MILQKPVLATDVSFPRAGMKVISVYSIKGGVGKTSTAVNLAHIAATIRVTVNFGVAYGSDVARVKQTVLDEIRQLEDIMEAPPPQVLFLEMSDSSLAMCARVWVDDYDKQFGMKLRMTELVYNTLTENEIEIPFPTRTVYVRQ